MTTTATTFNPNRCPACSRVKGNAGTVDERGVATCVSCSGIFTTRRIYRGDTGFYVLPFMAKGDVPAERMQYFDLDYLGSDGVGRMHGWRDRETKLIAQVG